MDYAKRAGSLLTVLLFVGLADAQIPLAPGEVLVAVDGVPVQQQVHQQHVRHRGGLAQQKAEAMARRGSYSHVGGGYGRGSSEGTGFSTRSAQDAIRRCCYWNRRQPVDIGVARGRNGWYACVIYR